MFHLTETVRYSAQIVSKYIRTADIQLKGSNGKHVTISSVHADTGCSQIADTEEKWPFITENYEM